MKTIDELIDEKNNVYKEYQKQLTNMHGVNEILLAARISHEENINMERTKFKDLLKADPISVEAMIRTNTAESLSSLLDAEKNQRLAELDLKSAGLMVDSLRQEIEIRKMAMGEL